MEFKKFPVTLTLTPLPSLYEAGREEEKHLHENKTIFYSHLLWEHMSPWSSQAPSGEVLQS